MCILDFYTYIELLAGTVDFERVIKSELNYSTLFVISNPSFVTFSL